MTKDQALRLALEALEEPKEHIAKHRRLEAITAIKQALANDALDKMAENERELGIQMQPEPEPVAWVDLLKEAQKIVESKFVWKRFIDGTPLANDIAFWMADFAQQHTSPPKREPLTDDALIQKMLDVGFERNSLGWTFTYGRLDYHLLKFARAIEASHGIKENT